MLKLEGQNEAILEKLSQLESSINQVNERVSQSSNIDSTLEKELLDKMYKLSCAAEDDNHLELKPREMTIANILENGYTMLDINNSLEKHTDTNKIFSGYKPIDISHLSDNVAMDITTTKFEKNIHTLDSLLFD